MVQTTLIFFVITFSFKLELVLINTVINKIFNRGTYMTPFASHQCEIRCENKVSFPPEPFIYTPLHEMNTSLRMFVLGHFCCSQEYMQNDRDLIHSADTFF